MNIFFYGEIFAAKNLLKCCDTTAEWLLFIAPFLHKAAQADNACEAAPDF
jgi:hypothetical protein